MASEVAEIGGAVEEIAGATMTDENYDPQVNVEKTLAIIKPDAVHKSHEIEDIIQRTGFTIIARRQVTLAPEQASEFYAEHYGKIFFSSLVAYMSTGPCVALVLARDNSVNIWKKLAGPTRVSIAREEAPNCLRAIYGSDDQRNALHASDNTTVAAKEIRFFFPSAIIEPISLGDSATEYLARTVNPTLLKGLTELCKQKPNEPMIWLSEWLVQNNPYRPIISKPQVELQ